MLVSHRHKFIYLKTKKTASTSVEVFFEPYCMPEHEYERQHHRDQYVSDWGIVGYRGPDTTGRKWWNHMSAREIRGKLGEEKWSRYTKFCVIRNPYEKAVSFFNHRRERASLLRQAVERGLWGITTKALQWEFELFLKRGNYAFDRDCYMIDGQVCVDHFVRYDKLESDLKRVCGALNIPYSSKGLPKLKTGYRNDQFVTADYYNKRSLELIRKKYRWEIESFDYSFPKR